MAERNSAYYREPNASSAERACRRAIDLVERFEQARGFFGRNTGAGVRDAKLQMAGREVPSAHANRTTVWREFGCVVEHLVDTSAEPLDVTVPDQSAALG